jgi:hypothetical protein
VIIPARMLDARCSMLDARCSMLDARCSMPQKHKLLDCVVKWRVGESSIQNPESSIRWLGGSVN